MDSKQTVEGFDQEPDVFVFCSFVDPDSGSARILTQVVKNDPKKGKIISYKVRMSIYVRYVPGTWYVLPTFF
jgi:hypothetical protein